MAEEPAGAREVLAVADFQAEPAVVPTRSAAATSAVAVHEREAARVVLVEREARQAVLVERVLVSSVGTVAVRISVGSRRADLVVVDRDRRGLAEPELREVVVTVSPRPAKVS
jgi:hypothetical protein